MSTKDENEALGAALKKQLGAAAREIAGEKLTGNAKVLNDLLDEVAGQQQRVTLRVFRRGFGGNQGQEEFITTLQNMDPELIREGGIEPMIQQYCGGGSYRVVLSAPGVPSRSLSANIAGEPINLKSESVLKSIFTGMPGQPTPVLGPQGLGFNFGQVQAGQAPQQQQSHLSEAVMLAQFMMAQKQTPNDSDEMKLLRQQLEELKMQKTAAEAERARIESERRADAQIAELKAQMERLAVPKEDSYSKFMAALPGLAPMVVGYFQSRDAAQREAAQAQREAAQAQTNMMLALFTSQGNASKENLELLKTMMLQPKETETDRMRGVMEIATSSMSTTMGLTQAMINQMASMQPENRPPWMEILMTVIENASQMGQAFLEAKSQKMAEEPPPQMTGPVEVRSLGSAAAAAAAAAGEGPQDIEGAAAAAAAAAQEGLATPDPELQEESEDDGIVALELPDFRAGAFKTIFELIQNDDANPHEVAFRIWKHATSGDKNALLWVRNPKEYTFYVLDTLAQHGQLLVTAQRIQEVAKAMEELFAHFRLGMGAQAYVDDHKLGLSLPKRLVVVPIPPEEYEEAAEEPASNPPADMTAIEEEELDEDGVEPEVLTPVEPSVPPQPTPVFGSAPPKLV